MPAPRFVLVHGAWIGPWCWTRVVPLIREEGAEVYAESLTGLGDRSHLSSRKVGIDTHIADVLNLIEHLDLEGVTLVGHSYAGLVVTGVADAIPGRISKLIYVDSNVPDTNRSSMMGDWTREERRDTMRVVRERGDGWNWPMPDDFGKAAADISQTDFRLMKSKSAPQPIRTFTQRLSLRGDYRKIPRVYIRCTSNPYDRRALEGKGLRVVDFDSGHWPMISKPKQLARLLMSLAESA
jgi:pimeloyl-ACP methyl ester carboxylesterase